MEKKKVIRESIENTIDNNTGEVIEQKTTKESYVEREPDYVKLYLQDIAKLNGLSNADSSFMNSILKRMDYDNEILLVSHTKKKISAEINVKIKTIDKAISVLVKKKILFRIDRGVYRFNPYLFGRGKWKDIKAIRLEVTYSSKGKELVSVIDRQTDLFDAVEQAEKKQG